MKWYKLEVTLTLKDVEFLLVNAIYIKQTLGTKLKP
jgi:hypothetical protein